MADEVGKGIANRGWGEEDGAGEQVGGRQRRDGMEGGAEPAVGGRFVLERAEPIEAEEAWVTGEKGGAGGVAGCGVGEGVGEVVSGSRCDGGGRKHGGQGAVSDGWWADEEGGTRVEGWVGGLDGGEEGAEPAIGRYPAGWLMLVEEVEGCGVGGWGGGCVGW